MRTKALYHILFWFLYVLFMGFTVGRYDMQFERAYIQELLLLPVRMGAVYATFYFIDKRKTNHLLTVGNISLVLGTATLIDRAIFGYFITPRWFAGYYTFHFWDFYRLPINLADMIMVTGLGAMIKLLNEKFERERREKELTKEKMQAELQFLKAQTNPHFLFNTINNIYALARKKSDKTEAVILHLSKLLRFMLYENQEKTIPVKQEVSVIKDFIELEKLRFDERLTVDFSILLDDESQRITPLLLLPLVENAFKHGASESRFKTIISISLTVKKCILEFNISNSKETGTVTKHEGIGLKNIKRQLELMYPDAFTLDMQDSATLFSVILTINLSRYAEI